MNNYSYKTFVANPITGKLWSEAEFNEFNWSEFENESKKKNLLISKKEQLLNELKNYFESKSKSLTVKVSIGNKEIEVNATREALQNVDVLLRRMSKKNLTETDFRLANDSFVAVSFDDVVVIQDAIEEVGLELYHEKWDKENSISKAKLVSELEKIGD